MSHTGQKAKAKLSQATNAVAWLVCLVPLVVSFSASQSVDAQALIIIMSGGIAWWEVRRKRLDTMPTSAKALLYTYVISCLVSVVAHPSFGNIFGSWLFRLGPLVLVASIGCGLVLRSVPADRLASWLYGTSVALAVLSLPYALLAGQQFGRLGGTFRQADILAVWMGCGMLLGLSMWRLYPSRRRIILLSQTMFVILLALTQTRSVVLFLVFVFLLMILRSSTGWRKRLLFSLILICAVTGCLFVNQALSARLTSPKLANESLNYRLQLQSYALHASVKHPLFGYGVGDIPQALNCNSFHSPALLQTCHEGYYFDSSHNIFLDRVLGLGWIGGLAFTAAVILLLRKGLGLVGTDRTFAYCALVIALYYLTNVTNVTVEVLFWVFLLRAVKPSS